MFGLLVSGVMLLSVAATPGLAQGPIDRTDDHTVAAPVEPGPKGLGPAAAVLNILDADGKPAAGAEVALYSDLSGATVWTGKTNPQGHVTVVLDEDLRKSAENIVDTNFTIRVFLNDQMTVHHLGFTRVKDTAGMSKEQVQRFEHPQKYQRTLQLERVNLVEMPPKGDVSIQVVDQLISSQTVYADTKIGQVSLANGMIATFTHGSGSTLAIDAGYKTDDKATFSVQGSYNRTTSSSMQTTLTYPASGSAGPMCDYYSGTCYEAYALPVMATYSYSVNKYAHWVDCQGCNLGYYWEEVVPGSKGPGGYFDDYSWTLSLNNLTPSGTQGSCYRNTGCSVTWDYKKGDKWAGGAKVNTPYGSFTGGVAKDYYLYTRTSLTVGTWAHTYYDLYDYDSTSKNWYIRTR